MTRVMFICSGNTCRSAMAHKMLEKMAKEMSKEIEVFSCGTDAWDGECPTDEAIKVMEEYEVDLKSHRSIHMMRTNMEEMDIILCATRAHKFRVLNAYPHLKDKVYTMKEYTGYDTTELDIKDPWGYNLETYRRCVKEIEMYLQKIIEQL